MRAQLWNQAADHHNGGGMELSRLRGHDQAPGVSQEARQAPGLRAPAGGGMRRHVDKGKKDPGVQHG
eukprot:1823820-Pyramimonas_sp.AAC.1